MASARELTKWHKERFLPSTCLAICSSSVPHQTIWLENSIEKFLALSREKTSNYNSKNRWGQTLYNEQEWPSREHWDLTVFERTWFWAKEIKDNWASRAVPLSPCLCFILWNVFLFFSLVGEGGEVWGVMVLAWFSVFCFFPREEWTQELIPQNNLHGKNNWV